MMIKFSDSYDKEIVISMGVFDTMHVGHRKLINTTIKYAIESNAEASVFTFSNNPLKLFNKSSGLVYSFLERVELLEELGIKNVIYAEVDQDFVNTSAEQFLDMLTSRYNIKRIVIGRDFTYGKGKSGDRNSLIAYMSAKGIEVTVLDLMYYENERISSARIRKLLYDGEIVKANILLGKPYFFNGVVVKGRKIGSMIGYPTINMIVSEGRAVLKEGVYLTKTLVEGKLYKSITNVGSKPTFNDNSYGIETHILGVSINLYDKNVRIYFYEYMRAAVTYQDSNLLKMQLDKDKEYALEKRY